MTLLIAESNTEAVANVQGLEEGNSDKYGHWPEVKDHNDELDE